MSEKSRINQQESKLTQGQPEQSKQIENEQTGPQDLNKPALDDDWLEIVNDWQNQPFEHTDILSLLSKTKRRTLWAKLFLAMDILSVIALYALFAYVLLEEDWETATLVYVGVGCIIFTVYLFYAIKVRVGSWRMMTSDPDHILESAIIGCRSSIQYIKLIKWFTLMLLPAVNLYLYAIAPHIEKPILPVAIYGNGMILLTLVITQVLQRKRERELNQLISSKEE